ncbi:MULTISPECIES: hypothetical protein [Pseudomonas]|uniref:hypothetical protein n=1 Tax=Pseudomonas TaxID=286 RepID=UPI000657B476|nr:hypothetical protein [Pseudomonas aeruginosa]MBO3071652.1 hypothetical protein [Pseudomonas aeruginosa]MDC0848590.1 hypothetical protein [Pseudomonas aeruginosa]PWH91198.1 hypothetical protein DI492_17720 [Pseudomonas aeruginosa]CRP69738.1 hypothetical protein PAERUG_P36_West_Midlands_5_VIM_2_06_12_05463 [Pseudomonas aeruginosa]HCE7976594.1 hypothetical protein [Pseudomonas aeruginosa]
MSNFVGQGLTDIDSLALAVRDPESKRLIGEALSAYRGGALRSAIVSTWIAVDYDIIAKAKELAAHSDAAAIAFVQEIEQAIQNSDVKKMQAIESAVLATANEKLQLFAPHEFEDLNRLQRDRHLCAHPAFATEDTLFQPTPELVRTHITHALKHLLINAPLQGKSAIERFHADLLSPSFPVDGDSIGTFVRTKYLDRAKDVMVVNLIKSLLSAPFGNESAQYIGQRHQVARTLREIAKAKTGIYDETAKNHVARKFDAIPDGLLLSISAFVECDARVWGWLSEPTRIRFKKLLNDADAETLKTHSAFDVFGIPELAEILLTQFESFEQDVQVAIISQAPRKEFISPAIRIYGESWNWRGAENSGRALMIPLAPLMTSDDIKHMLDSVKDNGQVLGAHGTEEIFKSVLNRSQSVLAQSKQHWQGFLNEIDEGRRTPRYPELRAKLDAL